MEKLSNMLYMKEKCDSNQMNKANTGYMNFHPLLEDEKLHLTMIYFLSEKRTIIMSTVLSSISRCLLIFLKQQRQQSLPSSFIYKFENLPTASICKYMQYQILNIPCNFSCLNCQFQTMYRFNFLFIKEMYMAAHDNSR